ncbi:MAG: hypothetical protein ABI675_07380 [Chitinophagaceae bacterium]
MRIRNIGFLILIVFISCKNGSNYKEWESRLIIPKDSCIYEEFIGGINKNKVDTLTFIRLNLETGSKNIFVNDQLNIGIETVRRNQNGNQTYNFIYADLEQESKLDHFIEIKEGNTLVTTNFTTNKTGKRIDGSCQVIMDKIGILIPMQDLVVKDRIHLIADMIKKNTSYSQLVVYSFLSDKKNVFVLQL